MFHGIEVHLMADIEKYKQGMEAAKKIGSESMGFISSIFDAIKRLGSGMWDSLKSAFSGIGSASKGTFDSMATSASGAFQKVGAMLPSFNAGLDKTKQKLGETEEESEGLATKIGVGLVVAITAAAAAITVLVKKGLEADAALASVSVSGNLAASQISRFEATAARSNVSATEFAGSMVKLREEMKKAAAGSGGDVFDKMGVTIVDANNALLKTDEVTVEVAKKIAAMSTEAEKYAAAAKIGFEGKVQVLEDIARASDLSATTTDEQAAAVVRLGKIWHDILPGGKSMWAEISSFLTASLTPAMAEASVSILAAKNKITAAFKDIFGAGSMFPALGEKIKDWGQQASQWFGGVADSAASATVKIMQFIAAKTGIGNANAPLTTVPGAIPGSVPLASDNKKPVVKDEEREYEALAKAIQEKIDIQKLEIQTGAALTEGQRMQIKMDADLRDGTVKLTGDQKAKRNELLATLIVQEKANAAAMEARKNSASAADKEAKAYESLIAAIVTQTNANKVAVAAGEDATQSQKNQIKLEQELAAGKITTASASYAVVRAKLLEQAASENALKQQTAEKEVAKFIAAGTLVRDDATRALAAEYAMYGKSSDAREMAMVAVKAETEMQRQLDALREKKLPIDDRILSQLRAERDARALVGEATLGQSKALAYANQLKEENTRFAAESLADPKGRADALLKIDADIWRDRIALAGAGTEAQKALQTEFNTWYANQSTKVLLDVDVTRATEVLKIMEAMDAATRSAASGMADSFGSVGEAIGGLTTALSGYAVQQQAVAAQLAAAIGDAKGDPTKIAQAQAIAARQGAQAQVKSYGDMASAAKGFFKENSAGYKVMETAEKAFRAYEMAMAVESMVKKIFFKETEVATNLTLNATKLTGEATASAASTGLAATEASAWGITAVVKALASLPFPLNLAAGAATLAAVVAIGAKMLGGMGGSSVSLSEQRQAATGTGSVLGDSSAKSESIAHSLAIMEKNSGLGLAHTISMDQSLKQMVAGIGNLGNLLARSGITTAGAGATAGIATGSTPTLGTVGQGVLTGAATYGGAVLGGSIAGTMTMMGAVAGPIGMAIGAAIGFVVSKLIKTSVSVKDSGITGAATSLGNVDALGFDAQAYADINIKKKAFGISYSSKNSTQTAALSDEMNDQFTMIITSMGDTIRSAADVLGLGGAAFNAHLNAFVVDLGKISLKDLTGEEQQKALETAFSKMGDDMAKFGVAGLAQYQAVGEGYLETLVRVTNDYLQVSDVLAVLGKSFNATGLGAVALSEQMIAAAGGLDKLTSGTGFFVENFLTEAERMAPITKSVNDAMGKLGLAGVTTMDGFKAAVLSAADGAAVGKAGAAELYAALLGLAEPFKTAADYAAEVAAATGDFAVVAKTASEIASEHRDLQQQLNELTKSENELLAIQRAGIADVNKALFDQVQAAKAVVTAKDALAKAYDTEAAAAKTALDKSKSWVTTLNGLNASMALGAQSPLTPEQRYAEARAQFEKTLAAANAGDASAQSGLSAAEQAFLTASQVVNASDARYVADYARVMAANEEAMRWASTQVDVAQASLDALTAQVSGLITINDSVLTVAQAITNLQVAMGVSNGLGVEFTNAPAVAVQAAMTSAPVPVVFDATRYSAGSNVGSDALVAEIRALNSRLDAQTVEIKGLREDQKKQTGATIQATVESNASAAKTVVAGVDKSAKTSAWEKANRKVEYV